ncbi:Coactosin-like protein [Portunus trituberculatus]|uniref:Coactosin-like protein n=1 Tax=Portunus trituberculatus TaxID=210409 RepID=A0A5B7E941_PORTR|nr:Coactosin-like protein [Portunus trituberculatus]
MGLAGWRERGKRENLREGGGGSKPVAPPNDSPTHPPDPARPSVRPSVRPPVIHPPAPTTRPSHALYMTATCLLDQNTASPDFVSKLHLFTEALMIDHNCEGPLMLRVLVKARYQQDLKTCTSHFYTQCGIQSSLFGPMAVFKYEGSQVMVAAKGESFDDFKAQFGEDERAFAYIRLQTGDEMSKRSKFLLVTWVGLGVSPIKKAKMSTDKALVKEILAVSLAKDDVG